MVRRVRSHLIPPPPPQVPEVHLFLDQRLKHSEFRALFYSNSLIVWQIENAVKLPIESQKVSDFLSGDCAFDF